MDQTPPMPGPAPTAYAVPGPAAGPPRPVPRATGWLLRLTLTLLALACVAQPLLIGRYLDGDFDAIGLHSGNGILLVLLTTATGVVALLWMLRGGHWAPFVLLVGLWWAIGVQLGMGYSRNLTIHVPLGVGIVGAALGLAGWAWTPRVFRRRR